MQKALDYILENLLEEITLEDMCRVTGYSPTYFVKKFKENYGYPWVRFICMLRMRMAAEEILKNEERLLTALAEKYGFSGPNAFSKAFKRELGVSPGEFEKKGLEVPDMPLPKTINGKKVFCHFLNAQKRYIQGRVIKPEMPMDTSKILSDCAYPLDRCPEIFQFKGAVDQIGIWWGEKKGEYLYILGHEIKPEQAVRQYDEPGMKQLVLNEGSYALFTLEISDSLEETVRNHRDMVYYVMKVWQKINHKVGNIMLYTLEEFTQNYTRLWLPLYKGMPRDGPISDYSDRGIRSWIVYIDQHLTQNLTIEEMAAYYNYSERHLRRSFEDNYRISLSEYIKEIRLYRTAEEMEGLQEEKQRQMIARKYKFRSQEAFQKQFFEAFGTEPDEFRTVPSKFVDPSEHISEYREKIRVTIKQMGQVKMIGMILKKPEQVKSSWEELPIPELASYWIQHDFDGLKGTRYECRAPGSEDKIGLWIEGEKPGEPEYILGPVVEDFIEVPEDFLKECLPAGKYIVMESVQESDESNLTEVYYMLRQFTDIEWFHQGRNMARYNPNKKAFIRYNERKLHYYIPVYY